MTYNDIIKELESIGLEIDYSNINVHDLNDICSDKDAFIREIKPS